MDWVIKFANILVTRIETIDFLRQMEYTNPKVPSMAIVTARVWITSFWNA